MKDIPHGIFAAGGALRPIQKTKKKLSILGNWEILRKSLKCLD